MEREEIIAELKRRLGDPAFKADHAKIRAKLNKLPDTMLPETVRAPNLEVDQTEGDVTEFVVPGGKGGTVFGPSKPWHKEGQRADEGAPLPPEPESDGLMGRAKRGLKRVHQALDIPARMANKALDTATFGLYGKGTDALSRATGTRIGTSPEQMEQLEADHPYLANTASAVGGFLPGGAPSVTAQIVSKPVDALTRVLSKRLSTKAGRMAERTLSGMAKGAGTAGAVAAADTVTRGGDLDEAASAAGESAKLGSVVGGALGAASGAGREIAKARLARSPDLRALDEYGLEPGPIPGRPVIRKDFPIRSQLPGLSEPPLVGKASPSTRSAAGRVAADEILDDMRVREKASNQRFGEMRQLAHAAEGQVPADDVAQAVVANIDARLADGSLSNRARAGLVEIRKRLAPAPPDPRTKELDQMLANPGLSPTARRGLESAKAQILGESPQVPKRLTAGYMDQVRDFADSEVRAGNITKDDVQFIQVADMLRSGVKQLAPRIAAANEAQSQIMGGFAQRRDLLGTESRMPDEGPRSAAARRIRERGEDTATAGARTGRGGHAIDRLIELGPPEVLPGTKFPEGAPSGVGMKALLDVPRLQLAQENLQANPGRLFSGAGGTPGGLLTGIGRFASLAPDRAVYPLARRLGEAQVGTKGVVADELTGAMRRRREKKRAKQGAEMSTGGER